MFVNICAFFLVIVIRFTSTLHPSHLSPGDFGGLRSRPRPPSSRPSSLPFGSFALRKARNAFPPSGSWSGERIGSLRSFALLKALNAFLRATASMSGAKQRWAERATRGMTHSELAEGLAYELGIFGGSCGPGLLALTYQGAGL